MEDVYKKPGSQFRMIKVASFITSEPDSAGVNSIKYFNNVIFIL